MPSCAACPNYPEPPRFSFPAALYVKRESLGESPEDLALDLQGYCSLLT